MIIKLYIAIFTLSLVCILWPILGLVYFRYYLEVYWVIFLNTTGWLLVVFLFFLRLRLLKILDFTARNLGLTPADGVIEDKVVKLSEDLLRFHKLYLGYQNRNEKSNSDLGENLREIAQLAYEELGADSVELSLFDEASKLWTQSILIGNPHSDYAQSLLLEAANNQALSDELLATHGVLVQPVCFAGYLFGTLRIELDSGVSPSAEHRKILELLTTQAALMLIDSRFTNEIIRMRKNSEESVKAKTGFLANLSHEIRGPLGVILSGVELILDGLCGEVSETQNETLQMIKHNGEHLLDLVNDVLDYAKAEAGKVKAKPVELSVQSLLTDLTNVVRSQAIAKKHRLIVEPVDAKIGMICDKRHARQILINMLTNAIKYTPEQGSITVSASRMHGSRVKISIADTGIGIPDEEKDKVFSAFERVDDKYAQGQMGTGLGMPITKRLTEINKGSIDFESQSGNGSTFWITMPATEIEPNSIEFVPVDGRASEIKAGHGEQIVLVLPNNEEKDIFLKYLSHQGFVIAHASTGSELIKLLREKRYDVAIVDNDFPDLVGDDLVALIRNNPSAKDIPVMMLSSKAFVFDIEHFLKLGVDRCLTKPLELSELARTIRQLIDESKTLHS